MIPIAAAISFVENGTAADMHDVEKGGSCLPIHNSQFIVSGANRTQLTKEFPHTNNYNPPKLRPSK